MNKMFNNNTIDLITRCLGEESLLTEYKVYFSSLVCKTEKGLNIILKNEKTPKFRDDWHFYMTMRSICRSWMTTGKSIREEIKADTFQNIDFLGCDDIENYFNYGNKEKQLEKVKKKVFILSRNLSLGDLYEIPFFKEDFAEKYIAHNPCLAKHNEDLLSIGDYSFMEYCRTNNINIIDDHEGSVGETFRSIFDTQNSLPLLCEVGPTTFTKIIKGLEGNNYIEVVILSVYEGYLDEECFGPEFPSMSELEQYYKLIHISEKINSNEGFLVFYTFIKK